MSAAPRVRDDGLVVSRGAELLSASLAILAVRANDGGASAVKRELDKIHWTLIGMGVGSRLSYEALAQAGESVGVNPIEEVESLWEMFEEPFGWPKAVELSWHRACGTLNRVAYTGWPRFRDALGRNRAPLYGPPPGCEVDVELPEESDTATCWDCGEAYDRKIMGGLCPYC